MISPVRAGFAVFVLCSASLAQSGSYALTVSPGPEPRVDVVLDAPASWASRTLVLSQRYAFARLAEPVITGEPQVISPAGIELVRGTREGDGSATWTIPSDLAEPIRIAWSIPVIHRTLPEVRSRGANEHPYLDVDHGLLVTAPLLLVPMSVDERDERAHVTIDVPDGWDVHAPWPRDEASFTPRIMDLHNDLVAVGDWSVEMIELDDFVGTVAFAPGQELLRDLTLPHIERVIPTMRALFDSPEPSRYAFFFGRPDMLGAGYTGSPKSNAMTLAVSEMLIANVPERVERDVAHLIAHEFHHTWTSMRATDSELRFFNEGFTDYYAWLALARLGVLTWDEFAAQIAEKTEQATRIGERTGMTLVAAGGPEFFQGGDAYNLCYAGGLVVAAHVDATLREVGTTLDDWMHVFNNREDDAPRDLATFVELLAKATNDDVAARVGTLVREPFPADATPLLESYGVSSAVTPRSASLRANLDHLTVRDLDPSCVHAEWGLRVGDTFVEAHGTAVRDAATLRREVSTPRDGAIHYVVQRGGERVALGGQLGERRTYHLDGDAMRQAVGG